VPVGETARRPTDDEPKKNTPRSFVKSICIAESSASTADSLHRRKRKHRQPVIHAALAQATSYTGSASYTGNQLYR
jgi:hypothetical protein